MKTVLGLSMTSTSVGWVLLDGQSPDATTLDHDSFDVRTGASGDTSVQAAAARGAQAIATASGHKVGSIQVTWTEDVAADATALLKSLADLGFDSIRAVPLSKAGQAWGLEVGRENEHTKTGLCVLEPGAALIMVVASCTGAVRTAITDTRETPEDLVEWLQTVFRTDGWLPEGLYLVGALADLDAVAQPIAEALPIPVFDSVDTQIALARGAALAHANAAESEDERPWRLSLPKKSAIPADAATAVASVAGEADAAVTQVIEKPLTDKRRSDRPWLASHAKKVTMSAAAVAVLGAGISLAAGSALNFEDASTQAPQPAAAGAPVTSASVRPIPAPASASLVPRVQPLAVAPAPAPPPPAPPPPAQTRARPAQPLAVVAPQPTAAPVSQPTAHFSPPASVAASAPAVVPPAAPLVAPAIPPPAAPVEVPPAAPVVVPVGTGPAPGPVPPLAAAPEQPAPAQIAPAEVFPPPAAAPIPAAPAEPAPALGPVFGPMP
ncbi:MAG TPA: hypothetical protein VFK56_12000 [Mycobacterium sp.]|nr:hypothetical protein [Mycobacterium sp.]